MTNLPQTWQFHNVQLDTGVAAAIIIPAARGLSHVLTDLQAEGQIFGTAADVLTLQVLDGATIIFTWVLFIPDSTGPPATTAGNSMNLSELNLIGSVNTSMTIQFTTGIPGGTTLEQIIAQGYDL